MRDILAFGPAKSHPTKQAGVIDKIFCVHIKLVGCNKPWGTSDFAAVRMCRDGMSWRDAKRGGGGVMFPVAVASAALHSMLYGMRLGSLGSSRKLI